MQYTKILNINEKNDILKAINLLKTGHVVALPTETVYGLAADGNNDKAIEKIFIAKNRPTTNPLILHLSDLSKLDMWADNIPAELYKLAEHFWPGPLTFLLHKKTDVSNLITAGSSKIAVRIPRNEVFRHIIRESGDGLVAPSANLYTKISPTSADHVLCSLNCRISAILDGGPCNVGIESTILDLTSKEPTILRTGPITAQKIEKILGIKIKMPAKHFEHVPGNVKRHYQPNTKTQMMNIDQINSYIALSSSKNKNIGILHYSDLETYYDRLFYIRASAIKETYARDLYKHLHFLDQKEFDEIIIESPPQDDEWLDILDRLRKAVAS